MRTNHVRRDYYPMISGASSTDLTVTPSGSVQRLPWTINKIPIRQGRYFAYVTRLWMHWRFTIDQPPAGGAILYDDALADIVQGFELRQTGWGSPFTQSDTSGARLWKHDLRILNRYKHPQGLRTPSIPAADGDTARVVSIPIQFSYGCTAKPHHFAPPAALLNGALLDVFANTSAALDGYSTGAVWKSATLSVVAEVIWEPEPRLFVPVAHRLYEPMATGTTQRWQLDLGARKGLDGVDDSGGAGLLALTLPSSAAGMGGQLTVDEIARIGVPFLNIDTFDYPQLMSVEFLNSLQRSETGDRWPFRDGTADIAAAHTATQLFFPVVVPPTDMELSKVSFVKGVQEMLMGFTSSKAQATHRVWTQEAFPWDPRFILAARDRIFGDPVEAAAYVPVQKYLRKQSDEDKSVMDPKKKRLLPWTFVPGAEASLYGA